MIDKVGIDDFILECWNIDSTGWKFLMMSDLWWEIVAVSEKLGRFKATSECPIEVENTLAGLLEEIKETKNGLKN